MCDVAKFITGADLSTLHTAATIETIDDDHKESDLLIRELDDDAVPKVKDEEESTPYHKLRLLEMVKVIHLVHIPLIVETDPTWKTLNSPCELESYRVALTILDHIQPPRNVIPKAKAERMTFAAWAYSHGQMPHVHVPMDEINKLETAFQTSSYLSAKEVCRSRCDPECMRRWPFRIPSDTSVCHNFHVLNNSNWAWPQHVVYGTRNIVWYSVPPEGILIWFPAPPPDSDHGALLTWMVRSLHFFWSAGLQALQTVSANWSEDKDTHVEIHLRSSDTCDKLKEEARNGLHSRLEKLIKPEYQDFPGTITVKLGEPGQVCAACKGGVCDPPENRVEVTSESSV